MIKGKRLLQYIPSAETLPKKRSSHFKKSVIMPIAKYTIFRTVYLPSLIRENKTLFTFYLLKRQREM